MKVNLHPSIYSRYSLTDLWHGEDLGEVEASIALLQEEVHKVSMFGQVELGVIF